VLQRIEAVQRTTAATIPVIIGVGRKTPSNHMIQTLENTESVMIHSLHPRSPLFTTLPNINPSLLSNQLDSALDIVILEGIVSRDHVLPISSKTTGIAEDVL
jgi:tetrahydromethanopterin S-methyltransferase subunit B